MSNDYDEFLDFKNSLINENRFFVDEKYCEYIEIYLSANLQVVEKGKCFFRSRIHKQDQSEKYDEKNIRMPSKNVVSSNGRVNPIGINYFYTACNIDTCIAETKPSIGDKVTVGCFESTRYMRVIFMKYPLTYRPEVILERFPNLKYEQLTEKMIPVLNFIRHIMNGFRKPIIHNKELEYLPFQYFTEYCKKMKYDGIVFESSMMSRESGSYNLNYVFFDDADFNLLSTEVKDIVGLSYIIE